MNISLVLPQPRLTLTFPRCPLYPPLLFIFFSSLSPKSLGSCTNVSWNVGLVTALQYREAVECDRVNALRHYRSVVPMRRLTAALARNWRGLPRSLRQAVFQQLRLYRDQARQAEEDLGLEGALLVAYQEYSDATPSMSCHSCNAEIFSYFTVEPLVDEAMEAKLAQLKANPTATAHTRPISFDAHTSASSAEGKGTPARDGRERLSQQTSAAQRRSPLAESRPPPRKGGLREASVATATATYAPLCLTCRDVALSMADDERKAAASMPVWGWARRVFSLFTAARLEQLLALEGEALRAA